VIDYSLTELENWNEKIEGCVNAAGLSCYEQHFEICTYEDMLCYEAYAGMPSHYPHWSFGKAYERQRTFYQYNLVGLPYEMVINSDPCIAYLMRDNTLALQILTMAHVYGHNDFFKNNRLFKNNTRAELTVELFKVHADRVRNYLQDPSIGPDKVERVLNAAHALRFQVERYSAHVTPSREQLAKETGESMPDRLKTDLLRFLAEKGKLTDWERDLVNIVHEETAYFIPQIETKIMNEGWASFWHYEILKQLALPPGLHIEFLQRHNMVVRPHEGRINPYFLGFKLFQHLNALPNGRAKIMEARSLERDQSFLRRYLTKELCEELHLFSYTVQNNDIVVKEISDDTGWETVRNDLLSHVGLTALPQINPAGLENGTLVLEHLFDGRELDMNYAQETIKYVVDLWGGNVELKTKMNNKDVTLACGTDKMVLTKT
jgi:stage V sporulation protein R